MRGVKADIKIELIFKAKITTDISTDEIETAQLDLLHNIDKLTKSLEEELEYSFGPDEVKVLEVETHVI